MSATEQTMAQKSPKNSTMELALAEAAIMARFNELPSLRRKADDAEAALSNFEQDTPAHDAARIAMLAARETLEVATAAVVETEVDSPLVLGAKFAIYGDLYDHLKKYGACSPSPSTSLNGMAELIVRDLRRQRLAS